MTSHLLSKPSDLGDGCVQRVTPESAGWGFVGFEVFRLKEGESLSRSLTDTEVCLVAVTGTMNVAVGGDVWTSIGGRQTPFDSMKTGKHPGAVFVPAGDSFEVTAQGGELELGVCSAPAKGGKYPARFIKSEDIKYSIRGTGSNTRHVFDILPETEDAEGLLVVEVVTPSGNWSSYPSHKHDTDNLPHESYLEETYYHRMQPEQGFAFQRVYNDDRSLDESMAVSNGDVVMVPEGYHPCSAAHGYDLYYLNVMAGPTRIWKVNNEADHEWLINA